MNALTQAWLLMGPRCCASRRPKHEPISWNPGLQKSSMLQAIRCLACSRDAMQRLVRPMMHIAATGFGSLLFTATQNGSSRAAPITARPVSKSQLLTARSSGALCSACGTKLSEKVWRLQEGWCDCNPRAPERDLIATRNDDKTRAKGGDHHAASLLGRTVSGAGTYRVPALQGSNKCRSAAVWCLCFSVRHPGRPTSDETPSPALRVDAMQPVLGHKPSAMHILPSAFIVLCRNISRPICGLFVRIRSRLRRSGPRSEWTSIGTLTSQSGRDVVRKKGTSRRRLGESFAAGLLVHGCWVCASLVLTRRPLACLASILHGGESHWPPDSFLSQKARVGCQGLAEPVAERKPAVQFFLVSGCFWFGLTRLSPACRAWTVTPSSYTAVAV